MSIRSPAGRALAAALAAALGCGPADPSARAPDAAPGQVAASAAARAARWLRTDSLRARLVLADGRGVEFDDDGTEGDRYVRHSFGGPVAGTEFLVVERTFYEGWSYLLVHAATGRVVAMPGVPVPSPDGSRLLVASGDLEAGYVPNVLQIWRVAGDMLEKEWELETADYAAGHGWAASEPRWLGDDVAVVTRQRLRQGVPVPGSSPAWVVRRAGGWTVTDRAPAAR